IVGLNFWPPSSDVDFYGWQVGSDGAILMANALLWAVRKTGTNGPYPTIVAQPQSVSVAVGGSAVFSVTAIGDLPLSYSWFRDGVVVAENGGPSLTVNNVQLFDSGSRFSCVVSNAFGTAGSASATLTVTNQCGLMAVINFDDFAAPVDFPDTTHL